MGVCGEQSHLTCCIATIRAASIGLDKLTNSKAIRGFFGRDGDVLAHQCFPSRLGDGAGFEKRLDPVPAIFSADAGVFESTPGSLGSSVMPLFTTRPALESLAIAIASSSESYAMTLSTRPKIGIVTSGVFTAYYLPHGRTRIQ